MTSLRARHLKLNEKKTLQYLFSLNKGQYLHFIKDIENIYVEEMNDGGMGSLKFISSKQNRIYLKTIIEVFLKDIDDVPISVAINLDNYNELFEVDIWKVNFEPVIEIQLVELNFKNG